MSDEDIIRIANQAGWDVQNLDDGFGERLRRFAQALEHQPLYTAPPNREWVGLTLNEAKDFYDKYTDRAELINAIDKFLEEKNHG